MRAAEPRAFGGTEMMPSEIEQIARVAEKACAAAVNHPRNADVRADLFNALGAVVDAVFGESAATHSARLHDLLPQTGVWANIVRCRIDNSRNSKSPTSAALIQYPARDLLQLLSQLLAELEQSESSQTRPTPSTPSARVKLTGAVKGSGVTHLPAKGLIDSTDGKMALSLMSAENLPDGPRKPVTPS